MTPPINLTAVGNGNALTVEHLSAGYRELRVLHDVSVVVPAGAIVALLGPNGAGKTTLLRTVAGLLAPSKGRIYLHDHDVTHVRAAGRATRGLCLVPEGRGVYRGLTVRDNLQVQAKKGQQDYIERAVQAFPILGERLKQQAGTLSGGQQQMLAFAAAYVREPSLMLVDEASLGLAPLVVDEIFEFIQRRAREGTTVLLVDQFAARALTLASHAFVLRKGKIAYDGAAQELLTTDLFSRYLGADVVTFDAGS